MENTRLNKSAKNAITDIENIIDSFIIEVEELETELEKANERIQELEDIINNVK